MNENNRNKDLEERLKEICNEISENGTAQKLKQFLYSMGIQLKFGGGYNGGACDIILFNKKDVWMEFVTYCRNPRILPT